MSNWTAITIDTLYEAKVAALIDAASSAALGDGQADRVPGIIAGVVNEVRLACGKKYPVDSDPDKIPNGLRDIAVDAIIARLKKAIEQDLSEDERNGLKRYDQILSKVIAGEWPIDAPDLPISAPVEGGVAVELVRPGRPPGGRRCDDPCRHPFSEI